MQWQQWHFDRTPGFGDSNWTEIIYSQMFSLARSRHGYTRRLIHVEAPLEIIPLFLRDGAKIKVG